MKFIILLLFTNLSLAYEPIDPDNNPLWVFSDRSYTPIKNINTLNAQAGLQGHVGESSYPWSADYWAIQKGSLGFRYGNPHMVNFHKRIEQTQPEENIFPYLEAYLEKNPVSKIIEHGDIQKLSPSEKYDLLIGDNNFSLTKELWRWGRSFQNQFGVVKKWMGICNGWSMASVKYPRPASTVRVKSADGKHLIPFTPSDIKALSSLLWSESRINRQNVGTGRRCNRDKPDQGRSGRLRDRECFDINPGSWHISVLNKVGILRDSLIADVTYDKEVWNHPIISYKVKFFNVINKNRFQNPSNAIVHYSEYRNDPFEQYRDRARTSRIVGVEMDVVLSNEVAAMANSNNDKRYDAYKKISLQYDLELDEQNNIIGGEWYTLNHPDFVWYPTQNSRVQSFGEALIKTKWDGRSLVPRKYLDVATMKKSSGSDYRQPISSIVEKLVELSSGQKIR